MSAEAPLPKKITEPAEGQAPALEPTKPQNTGTSLSRLADAHPTPATEPFAPADRSGLHGDITSPAGNAQEVTLYSGASDTTSQPEKTRHRVSAASSEPRRDEVTSPVHTPEEFTRVEALGYRIPIVEEPHSYFDALNKIVPSPDDRPIDITFPLGILGDISNYPDMETEDYIAVAKQALGQKRPSEGVSFTSNEPTTEGQRFSENDLDYAASVVFPSLMALHGEQPEGSSRILTNFVERVTADGTPRTHETLRAELDRAITFVEHRTEMIDAVDQVFTDWLAEVDRETSKIEAVLVSGSFGKGVPSVYSDVDIAVVSSEMVTAEDYLQFAGAINPKLQAINPNIHLDLESPEEGDNLAFPLDNVRATMEAAGLDLTNQKIFADPFTMGQIDTAIHTTGADLEAIERENNAEYVIIIVPDANRIELRDRDGRLVQPPTILQGEKSAARLGGFLERMYTHAGPGEHDIREDLPTYSDTPKFAANDARLTADAAEQLANFLPSGVIQVQRGYVAEVGVTGTITFGNFRIEQRPATADEKDAYKEFQAKNRINPEARRAVDEAENYKTHYTEYDHMIITVGGNNYYLDLDPQIPDSILAARIVSSLGGRIDGNTLDIASFTRGIWNSMPIAERSLFVNQPADIYRRTPAALQEQVATILRTLARPLQIVDSRNAHINQTSVMLEPDPVTASDLQGVRVIFPPGTARERIALGAQLQPPPVESVNAARNVLNFLHVNIHDITQRQAVELVTRTMGIENKRALHVALTEQNSTITAEQARERLHEIARTVLGDAGYEEARDSMTIKRNRMWLGSSKRHERIRQSGGKLSARIPVINSWFIRPLD